MNQLGPTDIESGFDLAIRGGFDPTGSSAAGAEQWQGGWSAVDHERPGRPRLAVRGYGRVRARPVLTDTRPQPVLHDDDGWVDFGPAGGSYYYSRPRMDATGSLTLDGNAMTVTGTAWFDHQWGDFIAVGGGGWDWFAVNLDDGTRPDDVARPRRRRQLPTGVRHARPRRRHASTTSRRMRSQITPTGSWTSPHTGATYPSGWTVDVPGQDLTIQLTPTLQDQELDTRASTGVVYWEGSQVVEATRGGQPVEGEAYVELTGYAPSAGSSSPSLSSLNR